MLSKIRRLPIKGRLKTLKTLVSPLFIVKIAKNPKQEARFAIVVGKGVDKRAVFRNRLKRKLSESIRREIKNIAPGFDFLIIAKRQAQEKQVDELRQEIVNLVRKEKLII